MSDARRSRLQASSWFAVVRAYQECNRRYSQMLASFDLTVPQFDVMTAISALGADATPKAIAERLVVTRGNITGVLQRLQQRSLIATEPHGRDGRSFVCRLTKGGRTVLSEARGAAALFIERQLAPFDDAELRDTERTMTQMHAHLQTIDPADVAAEALSAMEHQE